MSLTFGSLFAGIGGLDLGFERAGMECKWQVEIDGYATRVLEKHWPNVARWDDVRTWPQPHTERVDLICGGFPCQDISYAGRGAGLDGERSGLFFEAIRVVRQLQPRFIVLENVAALLTRGMDRVLGTLAEIGFDAEWHCIPAAAVGAPHIRDRVFIYAYRYGQPIGTEHAKTLRHQGRAVADTNGSTSSSDEGPAFVQRPILQETRRTEASDGFIPGGDRAANGADTNGEGLPQRQREDAKGTRAICWPKPTRNSQWDAEPNVGRVANGVPRRVDRLKGLGNAVVPQVAEYIGRQILERI